MAKTEFFEPHLLPNERDYPDIGIEAETIYGLLLRARPMMNATNRRCYGDDAVRQIQDIIAAYTIAYDFPEERMYYLKLMWARIAVFLRLMRCIGDVNAIELKLKHEPFTPDRMKIELMNHIARLDEGATRWKRSVVKGTRARPAPREAGGHRNE